MSDRDMTPRDQKIIRHVPTTLRYLIAKNSTIAVKDAACNPCKNSEFNIVNLIIWKINETAGDLFSNQLQPIQRYEEFLSL